MAKLLTRGHNSSLVTFSIFCVRSSCSSAANFIFSQTPSNDHSYLNNNYNSSRPLMEDKYAKGSDDALKDLEKEGYWKGACDYPTVDDILPHILNLYGSRATPKDFEIYAMDATFEDPLTAAHGELKLGVDLRLVLARISESLWVKEIKSAFYSLGKVFSESRIVEYTIQENIISPGKKEIVIDNKQYYKLLGRDINMISLIKLYTEGGKIVRHEDWWNKQPLWNRDTVQVPVVGRVTEALRRGLMLTTHAMMGFGKD
ncbi:hypothetical protein Leryth_014614 [Lithospermum erythrorhizon]|nr:hypothetical protein Leryth_014614 [Lithospermum erythrorhizon]